MQIETTFAKVYFQMDFNLLLLLIDIVAHIIEFLLFPLFPFILNLNVVMLLVTDDDDDDWIGFGVNCNGNENSCFFCQHVD